MIEQIPIEVVELIKEKPVVAYLLMKITTKYLILSTEKKEEITDDEINNVLWDFLNKYEAGDEPQAYKPEELN